MSLGRTVAATLALVSTFAPLDVRCGVLEGTQITLSSGFLHGDKTELWVEGLSKTYSAGDIVVDVMIDGPNLVGRMSPFFVFRARPWDQADYEEFHNQGYIDADGNMLVAGLAFSFGFGESRIRLRGGLGYSWESLDLNFETRGLGRPEVGNDTSLGFLGTTMSLPFLDLLDVTLGWDLVLREGKTFEQRFESGRGYRIETGKLLSTATVGLTWTPWKKQQRAH